MHLLLLIWVYNMIKREIARLQNNKTGEFKACKQAKNTQSRTRVVSVINLLRQQVYQSVWNWQIDYAIVKGKKMINFTDRSFYISYNFDFIYLYIYIKRESWESINVQYRRDVKYIKIVWSYDYVYSILSNLCKIIHNRAFN